jgi:hypothetical protein
MKFAIAFLFLLTFFGNAYAAPNKEEYELQERCGKGAKEYFKDNFSYTEQNITSFYRNHFNKKLNKCFIFRV